MRPILRAATALFFFGAVLVGCDSYNYDEDIRDGGPKPPPKHDVRAADTPVADGEALRIELDR